MKIGIISPISRILIDKKSIRSLEATYLHKYLKSKYNCDVHYISKKIKETDIDYIDINTLNSLNDYDKIYIHNFNTNFFGGLVSELTIKFLRLISTYNNELIYYITDPKLKYQNIATQILKRKSSTFEVDITTDELKKIEKAIAYNELRTKALFTGYNYQPIFGLDFTSVEIYNVFKDIGSDIVLPVNDLFAESAEKVYDICYYGDDRGSYRNNKIKKYFNTISLNTLTIGCDLELANNQFYKKVDHSELYKLVQKSYSSLVIGDKEHENSFATMRFYENIQFEVVSFVDISYDSNKSLFSNQLLKDFNYIQSQEELVNKITDLKKDNNLYNQIINLQKTELNGKN
jgi:hypothetical protein